MAAMPFAGPLVGVPFDGLPALAWSVHRGLLHVLPGELTIALGGLLLWRPPSLGRRSSAAVAAGLVAVGIWDTAGPWIYGLFTPHARQSGLMFLGIPQFGGFSSAHQMVVKAFCHWLPGTVTLGLAVAWMAYLVTSRVARRGVATS
ncbi:MAG TPA: hypothetical protein VGL20_19800 [Candidatus Dormibacteraeota bacterium]